MYSIRNKIWSIDRIGIKARLNVDKNDYLTRLFNAIFDELLIKNPKKIVCTITILVHCNITNLIEKLVNGENNFMKKYKIASVLMIIHGGFMEIAGVFMLPLVSFLGGKSSEIGKYFSFRLPYLQENLYLMIVMGAIFGVLRLIGAIGLLKNRMWGLVLSVINCVTTMVLMIFMLPAGIPDGILAGSALVLILVQFFGDKKIIE